MSLQQGLYSSLFSHGFLETASFTWLLCIQQWDFPCFQKTEDHTASTVVCFLLVMTQRDTAALSYCCVPGRQPRGVRDWCLKMPRCGALCLAPNMWQLFTLHFYSAEAAVICPDKDPELQNWNPGHNEENRIEIRNGRKLLLSSSGTVHSIHIADGGKTCCLQGGKAGQRVLSPSAI